MHSKMGRVLVQIFFFPQKHMQVANRHMRRRSNSLIFKEVKINTMRLGADTCPKGWNPKHKKRHVLVRTWRKRTLLQCWWESKLVQSYSLERVWSFLKHIKNRITMWVGHPTTFWRYLPPKKENETLIRKDTCPDVYGHTVYESNLRQMDKENMHLHNGKLQKRKRSCHLQQHGRTWRVYC